MIIDDHLVRHLSDVVPAIHKPLLKHHRPTHHGCRAHNSATSHAAATGVCNNGPHRPARRRGGQGGCIECIPAAAHPTHGLQHLAAVSGVALGARPEPLQRRRRSHVQSAGGRHGGTPPPHPAARHGKCPTAVNAQRTGSGRSGVRNRVRTHTFAAGNGTPEEEAPARPHVNLPRLPAECGSL